MSQDLRLVATASHHTLVELWDGVTAERIESFETGNAITALAFSEDGTMLATGHHDGRVQLWDTRQAQIKLGAALKLNEHFTERHGGRSLQTVRLCDQAGVASASACHEFSFAWFATPLCSLRCQCADFQRNQIAYFAKVFRRHRFGVRNLPVESLTGAAWGIHRRRHCSDGDTLSAP